MTTKPIDNSVWFREFPDGDSELGILELHSYGWLMDVGYFAYFWRLDLKEWKRIGEL